MFGADEAGRGPVLGSLFVGFVDAPDSVLPDGLADSKDLDYETITDLAAELRADTAVTTHSVEITPGELDGVDANVTRLTAEAMATAIDTAAVSDRGVVDACHADPDVFADLVTQHLPDENAPAVDAEHEADTRVEQVMAASIIAKADREQHVAALREEYGDIGSGYPSDPATRTFLESYVTEHGELPACARSSWGTAQDVLDTVQQQTFADFD